MNLQHHAPVGFVGQNHLPELSRAPTRITVAFGGVLLDRLQVKHTGELVHEFVNERGVGPVIDQTLVEVRTAGEQVKNNTSIFHDLVDGLLNEHPLVFAPFTTVQRQGPQALFLVTQLLLC
ncbi:hypothetical protein D3C75_912090 [compost metagenome]